MGQRLKKHYLAMRTLKTGKFVSSEEFFPFKFYIHFRFTERDFFIGHQYNIFLTLYTCYACFKSCNNFVKYINKYTDLNDLSPVIVAMSSPFGSLDWGNSKSKE